MSNGQKMLVTKALSKTFQQGSGAVHAVRGVDMEIARGERVCMHGPSGAGKSTFLDMLGGLSRPSSGTVVFNGKELYAMSDRARSCVRNKNFGFIFQFYHLLPELDVVENVILPGLIAGRAGMKAVKKRAHDLIERVGMGHRLKHRPSRLSGGESQRVAIARALINSPDILFCDEPTGNLDSAMSETIYSLLMDISREDNMSVLVVSHRETIEGFFHSDYTMKDGILGKKEN